MRYVELDADEVAAIVAGLRHVLRIAAADLVFVEANACEAGPRPGLLLIHRQAKLVRDISLTILDKLATGEP